jgi:hypothetical protein
MTHQHLADTPAAVGIQPPVAFVLRRNMIVSKNIVHGKTTYAARRSEICDGNRIFFHDDASTGLTSRAATHRLSPGAPTGRIITHTSPPNVAEPLPGTISHVSNRASAER